MTTELETLPVGFAGGRPGVAAYLNHGRWVADCATWPGCPGAVEYAVPEGDLHQCNVCGRSAGLEWPDSEFLAGLAEVMAVRPFENRNWYPAGHPRGEANGTVTGQSLDDLAVENRENGVG